MVGCGHGELDKIYECLAYCQEQQNVTVDLLLICGDFQAVRNEGYLLLNNYSCVTLFL